MVPPPPLVQRAKFGTFQSDLRLKPQGSIFCSPFAAEHHLERWTYTKHILGPWKFNECFVRCLFVCLRSCAHNMVDAARYSQLNFCVSRVRPQEAVLDDSTESHNKWNMYRFECRFDKSAGSDAWVKAQRLGVSKKNGVRVIGDWARGIFEHYKYGLRHPWS